MKILERLSWRGLVGVGTLLGLGLLLSTSEPIKSQSNFSAVQLYCQVPGPPVNWLPCNSTTPLAVSGTITVGTVTLGAGSAIVGKVAIDQTTPGTTNGVQVNAALPAGTNSIGTVNQGSLFPAASTPATGNATGSTGAVVGTLAGITAKTTYICGFNVSGVGGTAAIGPITVAGLVGSSMVFQLSSAAAAVNFSQSFSPCVPASAVATAITVTTTADGTATAVDVNSWGYQQ